MLMPAPMKHVNLFILAKDEARVMRALGRLKLLHLEPAHLELDLPNKPREDRQAELERSQRLLQVIDELMSDFQIPQDGPAEVAGHLTIDEVAGQLRTVEITRNEIRRQLEKLEADEKQLTAMVRDLRAFTGLGIPMERINDFSFLHFAIGRLPATSLEELTDKVGDNVILLPHEGPGQMRHLVAITSKKGRFALEAELEKADFQAEKIGGDQAGLADELVLDAEDRLTRVGLQRQLVQKLRLEKAAEYGPRLRAWRRTVLNEIRIIEAEANFAYTEAACYITGWVPTVQINDMTEAVLAATDGRAAIEVTDPLPGAEPPSKFQHGSLLRPFTMLVAGYGFPKYREIEPTLFVAISFLAMFAFMFGDVGHGGALLAAGLLIRWRAHTLKTRDIGFLFGACGLASMLMGLVYGSYFGFTRERVAWLPRGLWHEAVGSGPGAAAQTMETLLIAVIGGTVLISVGLVFNIINRLRSRDWAHGIFDKFGLIGAVIYWAALWLAVRALVNGPKDLPLVPVVIIIALGVLVLFIREPLLVFLKRRRGEHAESLMEATIVAGVEVMEIFIGYLANSLSFLRLAAYAMSHFALLLATMEMARVLGGLNPAASVLMLVVGNLVIIVLEGMVAAIQAIRLEYYEFFGKFFSGMGRAYKPFEAE